MTRVSVYANTGRLLELFVLDCPDCGVVFGIDRTYDDRRRKDEKKFYCPNGHWMTYHETETARLRKEKDRAQARLLAQMDQTRAAEREAAEAKASEVRLRWRVGNGVCPCCNRMFPALAAHVATKHPDFVTDDLDRLSTRMIQLLASIRTATEAADAAAVDIGDLDGDWRSVRALERRNLVTTLDYGRVALTEQGWPLAEKAASQSR